MSGCLEFLKCVLCCVEEHEEDVLEGLVSSSRRNSLDVGSTFIRSVERISDRLQGSNNYTYAPIYFDDPPRSSSALPPPSSKFLSPPSISTPTRPKPQTSSANQSQFLLNPATISSRRSPFPPAPSTTSSKSSSQATTISFTSSPLPPPPSTSSSKSSHQAPTPASHTSPSPKPLPSFLKPAISPSKPYPSSRKASSSSPGPSSLSSKQPPSFRPTLSLASPNLINAQTKVSYMRVQKDMSPIYAIPDDIEDLIRRGKVPQVLNESLSPSTYKDYFAALLYAEDFYIEKWSKFKLENITLKLQDAEIIKKSTGKEYFCETFEDDKTFVEFDIDSCRERRPFLLSRDFAFARPSGQKTEPYKGIIYRVVRSTRVLVEFGEDFLLEHHSTRKYDVNFSFNRVCLKRAHQAIEAASDPSFRSFLFPDCVPREIIPTSTRLHFCNHKLDVYLSSAVREILSFRGPPPYLIEGPLCAEKHSKQLSRTGLVVQEAVQQIYRSSSKHRILICAPINRTCDVLMQGLKNDIPTSDMFRANAAFREIDGVPIDILPSCAYKGECFTCPSLQELRKFRIIFSTYVTTEPEAMVALANLAGENTAVIVTGAPGNHSGWVRSDIAREKGLMTSYFERIRDSKPESKPVDTYSYASFSDD
ncbi:unnamed protein product [Dovyalis caffra]|uniref:Helicase MOV-10-like beta-barrel domain-containing protein n=1 Tax=Dovyalis caffra TaxID=77055 RepID=A0AAV1RPS0_9ROSI|nr:unnamed protein product [Dovyalis caffra]